LLIQLSMFINYLLNQAILSIIKYVSKLKGYKRYQECELQVAQWNLLVSDADSFLSAYKEIF